MKFNPTIGKIYDTIFFLTEYFNGNRMAHDCEQQHDVAEMLSYYDGIKQDVHTIPKILKPFFFSKPDSLSILTQYFYFYLGNKFSDFDEFILAIRQDTDTLRNQLLSFFDNVDDDDAKNALSMEPNQIARLFGDFNKSIDDLCWCLEAVYLEVDKLHTKNATGLAELYDEYQTEKYQVLLANYLNDTVDHIDSATVIFSVLNQYIIFAKPTPSTPLFILGNKSNMIVLASSDNEYSTVDNFILSFSGETRVKILHAFVDHTELTSSQIARIIGCPPTTLIRPIAMLLDSKLIYVSRRTKLQIFYRLNTPLLKKTHKNFNKIFLDIFNKEVTYERSEEK